MDKKCESESILDDDVLYEITLNSSNLMLQNFNNIRTSIDLAAWALKNEMGTYYSVSATSGNYEVSAALKRELVQKIKDSCEIGENVIATTDFNTLIELSTINDVAIYKYKDAWLLFKKNNSISTTEFIDNREKITVADLTDANWEKGISKDGYCLLFKFSDKPKALIP